MEKLPRPMRPLRWVGLSRKDYRHFPPKVQDDFDGDTYRAVYTVRFESAIYVVHAFKKKSKRGIKTPQSDLDLVKKRLKDAEADYAARIKLEQRK